VMGEGGDLLTYSENGLISDWADDVRSSSGGKSQSAPTPYDQSAYSG
jgi:hypothetical protein